MKIKEFLDSKNKMLDRGIVATPGNRERLELFANANNGSNDFLLMQMAINFGYKLALEDAEEELL
jgi:hypothetical protein